MNRIVTYRNGRQGFTLIELLTVIAIIGILAAILIPVVGNVRESARQSQSVSNVRQVALAMISIAEENKGDLGILAFDVADTQENRDMGYKLFGWNPNFILTAYINKSGFADADKPGWNELHPVLNAPIAVSPTSNPNPANITILQFLTNQGCRGVWWNSTVGGGPPRHIIPWFQNITNYPNASGQLLGGVISTEDDPDGPDGDIWDPDGRGTGWWAMRGTAPWNENQQVDDSYGQTQFSVARKAGTWRWDKFGRMTAAFMDARVKYGDVNDFTFRNLVPAFNRK